MSKIYYYQQEVKIGDKVVINGVALKVTEQLIEDNPDLFKVAEEQEMPEYVECIKDAGSIPKIVKKGKIVRATYKSGDAFPYRFETVAGENGYGNSKVFFEHFKPSTKEDYLLQEAKRRYPKGTKFKSGADNDRIRTVKEYGAYTPIEFYWCTSYGEPCIRSAMYNPSDFCSNPCVYVDGQWAEIVKPIFTTEDGVEIFKGDEYWWFYDGLDPKIMHASDGAHENSGKKPNAKYFSSREAAEEYIAKHKEKTLEDYEKEIDDITSISGYSVYSWLKDNDRKLYYTKVLNAIADDLNDGKCVNRIFIKRHGGDYIPVFDKESLRGTPMFASKSDAMKAIKIMADKLDYIYKH
jgi:hypothetical protein